jgi:tRNA G18 (ribose-2'-O)-methylase SpoU
MNGRLGSGGARGYFGIGAEGMSKPMNLGALMRTGHAFGASFLFTVGAAAKLRDVYRADTSRSADHVPYYQWETIADMTLPRGCALVGVEITDDAVDLPRFHHPLSAAYVLGRERGSLSPELVAQCAHVVKVPTKFSLNVGLAGALVMYDRMLAHGGFGARGGEATIGRKIPY